MADILQKSVSHQQEKKLKIYMKYVKNIKRGRRHFDRFYFRLYFEEKGEEQEGSAPHKKKRRICKKYKRRPSPGEIFIFFQKHSSKTPFSTLYMVEH